MQWQLLEQCNFYVIILFLLKKIIFKIGFFLFLKRECLISQRIQLAPRNLSVGLLLVHLDNFFVHARVGEELHMPAHLSSGDRFKVHGYCTRKYGSKVSHQTVDGILIVKKLAA